MKDGSGALVSDPARAVPIIRAGSETGAPGQKLAGRDQGMTLSFAIPLTFTQGEGQLASDRNVEPPCH